MIAGVEEELLGSKGDWSDSWLSWHCALPGSVVLISALRHDLFKEGTPSGHPHSVSSFPSEGSAQPLKNCHWDWESVLRFRISISFFPFFLFLAFGAKLEQSCVVPALVLSRHLQVGREHCKVPDPLRPVHVPMRLGQTRCVQGGDGPGWPHASNICFEFPR